MKNRELIDKYNELVYRQASTRHLLNTCQAQNRMLRDRISRSELRQRALDYVSVKNQVLPGSIMVAHAKEIEKYLLVEEENQGGTK